MKQILFTLLVLVATAGVFEVRAQPEVVTSVSQVTDVKPTDPFYSNLQSLIERYGVSGMIVGGKLSPAQNVSAAYLQTLLKNGGEKVAELASMSGIPARILANKFGTKCAVTATNPAAVTEMEAATALKCAFGPNAATGPSGTGPLSRGRFVTHLETSLSGAFNVLAETSPSDNSVRKDFQEQVQAFIAAKKYADALALYAKLETGSYDYGDAAIQKKLTRNTGLLTYKAKVLVELARYEEADAIYYRMFDWSLNEAKASLDKFTALKAKTPQTPVDLQRAKAELSIAKGSLVLADSTNSMRNAAYLLAAAGSKKQPFDPARIARVAEMRALLATMQP